MPPIHGERNPLQSEPDTRGVRHRSIVTDRRLASLVRRCQELPGQTLFQWTDDGGEVLIKNR